MLRCWGLFDRCLGGERGRDQATNYSLKAATEAISNILIHKGCGNGKLLGEFSYFGIINNESRSPLIRELANMMYTHKDALTEQHIQELMKLEAESHGGLENKAGAMLQYLQEINSASWSFFSK